MTDTLHRRRLLRAVAMAGAGAALAGPVRLAWAQAGGTGGAAPSSGEGRVQLPVPGSLADALAQALARQQPLVVMVSLPGCPFCRTVRDGYLGALVAEQGQPVVQVDLRSHRALADFDGRATDHDALVRAWGVRVAPTLLFFGRGGREVAPRLVGASLPDFYGAYLDDRLAQARRSLSTN